MTRFASLILFLVGAVAFLVLVTEGRPAIGFAILIASSCAALVVSVTAFARDPDERPDDMTRFPPD